MENIMYGIDVGTFNDLVIFWCTNMKVYYDCRVLRLVQMVHVAAWVLFSISFVTVTCQPLRITDLH